MEGVHQQVVAHQMDMMTLLPLRIVQIRTFMTKSKMVGVTYYSRYIKASLRTFTASVDF